MIVPTEGELDESIYDFHPLPPAPSYDLPLWKKHSEGKLQGNMDSESKKLFKQRYDSQKNLFAGDQDIFTKTFVERYRRESFKDMKSTADIMDIIGCCFFPTRSAPVVINANDFIGDRACALTPTYLYDNNSLKLVVSTPFSFRKKKLPTIVAVAPVGLDCNHDVWLWQGKVWASFLNANVIYVCFRPVPEFEDPARMLDVVAAIKWASTKGAELYSFDVSRLGLLASSAGAFLATVAALELSARGDNGLLKSVFLEVPGIFPNDMMGPYENMSEFQKFINSRVNFAQYVWFAGGEDNQADWEKRFKDKDLSIHCLHAPLELMKKLPPHIIITAEFDDFRWQTDQYAAKLSEAGALADYIIYPSAVHMTIPMNQGSLLQEAVRIYL